MNRALAPKAILVGLLLLWLVLGIWIALRMPFGSGTDESIGYVAFAAAKNRWAGEEDFKRHGIDGFYYPPLYFLMFAPFWGDEPSFVDRQSRPDLTDPNYLPLAGRRTVAPDSASRVPPPLDRLYRQAKLVSVALGLVILLSLVTTLRLLFPGPSGWWVIVLGTTPLVFLPQFLYYQTLVNNDSLVNALSAVAAACFTAAALALERGRERRFVALSLAVAASIGLAFLTKMSAPVLLPFLAGLLWLRFRQDAGLETKARLGRTLRLLGALLSVVVLTGGWWIGFKASLGDWSSQKALALAHPWALVEPAVRAQPFWWTNNFVMIGRSYYALFSGALFVSVPDTVILAWLAIPLAVLGVAVFLAGGLVANRTLLRPAHGETGMRRVVWITFAGVMLLNVGSVLIYLRNVMAPYGRLLFPSLVVMHAVAAAVIFRLLRERRRALIATTLVLMVYTGLLFAWTFRHRMLAAVAQPLEDVRILNGFCEPAGFLPVWEDQVTQSLQIPPGNLVALRVGITRIGTLPQVGAALEGSLKIFTPDGRAEEVAVRRKALGDNGVSAHWIELELEREIRLGAAASALLSLRGSPPAWLTGNIRFYYSCSEGGESAIGKADAYLYGLCVAAVFRVTGGVENTTP